MMIIENVQFTDDERIQTDNSPSFANQSSHREVDLKNMFVSFSAQAASSGCQYFFITPFLTQSSYSVLKYKKSHLHELYVRYTMNPFSKLRSPIQSRVFDEGVYEMAREFNVAAVERAKMVEDGMNWM